MIPPTHPSLSAQGKDKDNQEHEGKRKLEGRGRRLTDHGLRAAALASQQSLLLRYCGLEVLAYARFRVYYTYIITKRERRAVESQDSAKERGRDGM